MIATHKMRIDFYEQEVTPRVDAVQDDKYSRCLAFSLYASGEVWEVPDGTMAVVDYVRVDGSGGSYDTLPDGTIAYAIRSNDLIVALAPQVLAVPGLVRMSVRLIRQDRELQTFEILLNVHGNVRGQLTNAEEYYSVSGFMSRSGWTPNMYLATDEVGNIVTVEEPECGGGLGTTVEEVLAELPISVSEDGYTDISGLRQATAVSAVRSDNTITITSTLEGGATSTSVITLDEDEYPIRIVTEGVECAVSWEGFDG